MGEERADLMQRLRSLSETNADKAKLLNGYKTKSERQEEFAHGHVESHRTQGIEVAGEKSVLAGRGGNGQRRRDQSTKQISRPSRGKRKGGWTYLDEKQHPVIHLSSHKPLHRSRY